MELLLELIAQSERSVDVLAEMAGLVSGRRDGLFAYFSLAGDDLVRLYSVLHSLAETRLADVDRILRLWLAKRDALEAGLSTP